MDHSAFTPARDSDSDSDSDSARDSDRPARIRRDGWTIARQARFLRVLAARRSVTEAARVVRMSRESAYRLRRRDPRGLFAAMWAQCFARPLTASDQAAVDQRHRRAMARAAIPLAKQPVQSAQLSQLRDPGRAAICGPT